MKVKHFKPPTSMMSNEKFRQWTMDNGALMEHKYVLLGKFHQRTHINNCGFCQNQVPANYLFLCFYLYAFFVFVYKCFCICIQMFLYLYSNVFVFAFVFNFLCLHSNVFVFVCKWLHILCATGTWLCGDVSCLVAVNKTIIL